MTLLAPEYALERWVYLDRALWVAAASTTASIWLRSPTHTGDTSLGAWLDGGEVYVVGAVLHSPTGVLIVAMQEGAQPAGTATLPATIQSSAPSDFSGQLLGNIVWGLRLRGPQSGLIKVYNSIYATETGAHVRLALGWRPAP